MGNHARPKPQGQALNELSGCVIHVSSDHIDRTVIRDLLSRILPNSQLVVIDTAYAALDLVRQTPKVILVLFSEQSLYATGETALAALQEFDPGLPLAVYGSHLAERAYRWSQMGVQGLISRRLDLDRFAAALGFVAAGNRYASPEVLPTPTDAWSLDPPYGLRLPLLDDLPLMMFLLHAGCVIYANRRAIAVLGYEPSEVLNRSFPSLLTEAQRPAVEQIFARMEVEPEHDDLRRPSETIRTPLSLTCKNSTVVEVDSRWARTRVAGTRALSCACVDLGQAAMTWDASTRMRLDADMRAQAKLDPTRQQQEPGPQDAIRAEQMQRFARLTGRQREVLQLITKGASNKEIGSTLEISEATAKLHVHKVLRTLHLSNRTEAALLARQLMPSDE